MKGRGTRVINPDDLKAVTPDADHKTHFVIVDAVGVCETDKTDSRPLERKKTIPFEKLVRGVALGIRDKDIISSLAGRLARLDREIEVSDRSELQQAANDKPLKEIINKMLDAVDPDMQQQKAKETFNADKPTQQQLNKATEELTRTACETFDDPKFRDKLIEVKKKTEQIIDTISKDEVVLAGFDQQAKERAQSLIDSFKKFIEDNKDEITALQLIYSKPFGQRFITYEQIDELAKAIKKPPLHLRQETLWLAYEQLEKSKVKKARADKILTDIISLLRFTIKDADVLEPWLDVQEIRFRNWLEQQKRLGRTFTNQQMEWLGMIKDHITTSLQIEMDDFEYAPFHEKGGAVKAYKLFGDDLNKVLNELNEVLAA